MCIGEVLIHVNIMHVETLWLCSLALCVRWSVALPCL